MKVVHTYYDPCVVYDKAIRMTLPLDVAEEATKNIKKSTIVTPRRVGMADLLIHWGAEEMAQLNKLATFKPNLPSPMTRDYNWPGLYKPFAHQKTTSEYLSINNKAFCFNEAGTGKTSSVLWTADYLMNIGKVKRVLIICPLSIMYSAWQGDVFNTCMHRTSAVCHGSSDKRKKIIQGDYDFIIINYDGVAVIRDEIKKKKFDLIVVDECNAYKSPRTARWKNLKNLITDDTMLWMMTGTPASQSPLDAYGLAKMVCPENIPKFSATWRDKVMYQISRFKWLPKKTAKDDVFKALQPAIRFAKDQCLDLPSVMYQTRIVPLTKQAEKYYKQLKTQMLFEAGGESVTAVNAASGLTKLLQISGGAVYTDKREVIEFDIKPRLSALDEVIFETDHKVIIFVPFRHTIDVVSTHLEDNHISNEVINGDVSATKRADIIDRFQTQDEPRVLVIQPQSASHGVTLTKADTVVFWSPVMSVEVYLQCVARIDRVGQKNKMTVVHLQGSDVEKRMYAMLQGKVDQHTSLVDLYREELESE
jgi:SNF2 family DNA or RNA helicase